MAEVTNNSLFLITGTAIITGILFWAYPYLTFTAVSLAVIVHTAVNNRPVLARIQSQIASQLWPNVEEYPLANNSNHFGGADLPSPIPHIATGLDLARSIGSPSGEIISSTPRGSPNKHSLETPVHPRSSQAYSPDGRQLSFSRITPKTSRPLTQDLPRGTLDANPSPKLRSRAGGVKTVQTVAGPLLASTRFNSSIDAGMYVNVNSPGFTDRLVRCATDSVPTQSWGNGNTASHQDKYSAVGLFPIVHLDSATAPTLSVRNSQKAPSSSVRVRIAPPVYNDRRLHYGLGGNNFIAPTSVRVSETNRRDQVAKSVLESLQEASRKRIYSQCQDVLEEDPGKKRQRKGEAAIPNPNCDIYQYRHIRAPPVPTSSGLIFQGDLYSQGKRARDDSNVGLNDAKRQRNKVAIHNNEISSSLSSSQKLLQRLTGSKRKAENDWSPTHGKHLKDDSEAVYSFPQSKWLEPNAVNHGESSARTQEVVRSILRGNQAKSPQKRNTPVDSEKEESSGMKRNVQSPVINESVKTCSSPRTKATTADVSTKLFRKESPVPTLARGEGKDRKAKPWVQEPPEADVTCLMAQEDPSQLDRPERFQSLLSRMSGKDADLHLKDGPVRQSSPVVKDFVDFAKSQKHVTFSTLVDVGSKVQDAVPSPDNKVDFSVASTQDLGDKMDSKKEHALASESGALVIPASSSSLKISTSSPQVPALIPAVSSVMPLSQPKPSDGNGALPVILPPGTSVAPPSSYSEVRESSPVKPTFNFCVPSSAAPTKSSTAYVETSGVTPSISIQTSAPSTILNSDEKSAAPSVPNATIKSPFSFPIARAPALSFSVTPKQNDTAPPLETPVKPMSNSTTGGFLSATPKLFNNTGAAAAGEKPQIQLFDAALQTTGTTKPMFSFGSSGTLTNSESTVLSVTPKPAITGTVENAETSQSSTAPSFSFGSSMNANPSNTGGQPSDDTKSAKPVSLFGYAGNSGSNTFSFKTPAPSTSTIISNSGNLFNASTTNVNFGASSSVQPSVSSNNLNPTSSAKTDPVAGSSILFGTVSTTAISQSTSSTTSIFSSNLNTSTAADKFTKPSFSFGTNPSTTNLPGTVFSAPSTQDTFGTFNPAPSSESSALPSFGSPAQGPQPALPQTQSPSLFSFGSTTTPNVGFGAQSPSSGTTSAFGSGAQSPISGTPAFGSGAQPSGTTSTFRSGVQPPSSGTTSSFGPGAQSSGTTSAFGSGAQSPSSGTSAFGSGAQPSGTTSAFGSGAQSPSSGTTSAYGSGVQPPSSGTTSAFGSPQPQGFGGSTSTAINSGFTSPPNSLSFGSAPSIVSTFGASSTTNSASTGSAFGAPQPANLPAFGQSATSSVFGGQPTPNTAAFGISALPNPSPFGNSVPSAVTPSFGTPQPAFGASASSSAFGSAVPTLSPPQGSGFQFSTEKPATGAFTFGASTSAPQSSFNFSGNPLQPQPSSQPFQFSQPFGGGSAFQFGGGTTQPGVFSFGASGTTFGSSSNPAPLGSFSLGSGAPVFSIGAGSSPSQRSRPMREVRRRR